MSVELNQIIPNIKMRLPSLTRTEQSIAENFLQPHFLQKSTSIKEVAERLGVSTALIVKVSKKLGFSGFKQLKDALNAHHAQSHTRRASSFSRMILANRS
ncbi:transcriptional regulator of D-allose utilization RpiR family [Vibrio variabilis]|uniref:Transcriptional regulator of D-allose utilization RpiR family n=1 Tax=Vibrio variabilis TaxID=990271 RepID=A0ABQ0J767_9VIBR|nr:transcriptional regulator of D-allose utilization RpiR family [Vibrio variabilis]